jgi:hypothetical protein
MYFHVPIEIIPWTHGNNSMYWWKSFYAHTEIIHGYLNSLEGMVAKDVETATWIEVIISIKSMEFLSSFHTVEISFRYMETFPEQTMFLWAFFHSVQSGTTMPIGGWWHINDFVYRFGTSWVISCCQILVLEHSKPSLKMNKVMATSWQLVCQRLSWHGGNNRGCIVSASIWTGQWWRNRPSVRTVGALGALNCLVKDLTLCDTRISYFQGRSQHMDLSYSLQYFFLILEVS